MLDLASSDEPCAGFAPTRASGEGRLRVRALRASSTELMRPDARQAALSPDGKTVAAAVLDADGHFQLAVFPVDDPDRARWLTRGLGHVATPAWSPDGRRIALLSQPVRDLVHPSRRFGGVYLFVLDLKGSIAQLTADGDLDDVRPLWTSRGIYVVAAAFRGGQRGATVYRVVPTGTP